MSVGNFFQVIAQEEELGFGTQWKKVSGSVGQGSGVQICWVRG